MKHPTTRAFFSVWDQSRGQDRAPYRSALQPGAMRELLGDVFVLGCDSGKSYPIRVAGTRFCSLFGADQKDTSFPALFAPSARPELIQILSVVSEELQGAVVGINAADNQGGFTALEMILLPFRSRAHAPLSLTGALVPVTAAKPALRDLALTSWRYLEPAPEPLRQRALRKIALARGLIVYEGVRG